MKWTQKELEELYQKANEKAISDPEFRKAVLADAKSALTELAGRELPEGFSLELVENDNSYASAYLAPNFTGDEIDLSELRSVAGGKANDPDDNDNHMVAVSVALIISVCGAAVSVGPCGGDVCGGDACGGNICGGAVCGGNACGGDIACGGAACGGNVCGGDIACGGDACGGNACGGNVICAGNACGGDACSGDVACAGNACAANVCGGNAACGGNACAGNACGGNAACGGNTCAANK